MVPRCRRDRRQTRSDGELCTPKYAALLRRGTVMNSRDEDSFRIKPRPPRAGRTRSGQRFVTRVLTQVSRGGGGTRTGRPAKPSKGGARLNRGQVAARLAGDQLNARSRRVVIKTRLVVLGSAGSRAVVTHLRYLARDGVTEDGAAGQAYDARSDIADVKAFEQRGRDDRHQFRFIVSPEDAEQIQDLRHFTRELMCRMERDLETKLEWVGVDHWDTDNPHTHVVLRGVDQTGRDLVIDRGYLTQGMRLRACEVASEWLGMRTERELRESLQREVDQQRWTTLDHDLQRRTREGLVDLSEVPSDAARLRQRGLLIRRLQRLETMGLSERVDAGHWRVSANFEKVLRGLGERGDIIRTLQRALGHERRELAILDPKSAPPPVIGRIASKGVADEPTDSAYLVVDGVDGRAYYVALPARTDLTQWPVGGIVEVRAARERAADRAIAAVASDGVYRVDRHLTQLRAQSLKADPDEIVAGHVRRLEALRRAGVVERISEGLWRVPDDLVARGKAYDAGRSGSVELELHSHLPIEHQVRALGATWLDRQLVDRPATPIANRGFGATVHKAVRAREDFLVETGVSERGAGGVTVAPGLLGVLRTCELEQVAKRITAQTGLTYRPMKDGTSTSGIYRRSIMLASGRFAMLDDGLGFSLVPWRPVVEAQLGRSVTAVARDEHVTWQLGRSRGLSR